MFCTKNKAKKNNFKQKARSGSWIISYEERKKEFEIIGEQN